VLSLISGYLLGEYSQAAWPYVDSFTTWGSVIATYLVARKYLENWLYWIVIDIVSIPLYLDRGLNLTALLFGAYVIIAIVGYFSWRNHYQRGGLPIEA
jgi:nicotinamide mononucleotide transporter